MLKNGLLLFLFSISIQLLVFHHPVLAANPEVIIEPDSPFYSVASGQSINTNIFITNNLTNALKYNITYRSNLPPDENTVGLWYFEESSGSQIIDETRKYNGSLHGPTWTDGIFGKALLFDGVDDYALVPNFKPSNLSSISIETWINFESLDYWAPIGGVKYESFGLLYRDDGVFRTHIWGQEQGLKWYDTLKPIEFNEWHYIVMTFESETGEISVYLDGVKIESRFEGPDTINEGFFDLIFGRGWTESMWHLLNGSIDEIRISNVSRKLSKSNIRRRRMAQVWRRLRDYRSKFHSWNSYLIGCFKSTTGDISPKHHHKNGHPSIRLYKYPRYIRSPPCFARYRNKRGDNPRNYFSKNPNSN